MNHFAKALALALPPVRRLYMSALETRAENAALKQTLCELSTANERLQRKQLRLEPRTADRLRSLLARLKDCELRAAAAAVQDAIEPDSQTPVAADAAIRDLLAFIHRNKWEEIADYKAAASVIESLSAAPVAPDVAAALNAADEALLCLRVQPAADYSLIFLQRNPINGAPFDGSFSSGGLISPEERDVLAVLVSGVAADGMKIAEIGPFLGRGSTRVFAEAVRPRGVVVCVDNFPAIGNFATQRDLFEHSTIALGFRNLLKVIEGDSRGTAARFPDAYFDLVFIDGGHGYDDVNRDIRAWRPKVRSGGVLCGHDCIRAASEFTPQQMQELMQGHSATARMVSDPRNPAAQILVHPGVITAVAKNFGTDAAVAAGPCGIWSYRVPS